MKKILLALCLSLSMPILHAEPTQAIFQQLAQTSLVRAHFEQQKKLVSLNKTFTSQGEILFNKQQGVLWQIKKPVQADLVVTPKKLVQKTQRTLSEINVQQSPYGSVATLFLQLMAGDQATLTQNFNVTHVENTSKGWQVQLTPKNALFKKLFTQVDAQGGQYVNQIVLQEKDGNTTTIRFSQQNSQPMNVQENELFKLAK